MLKKLRDKTADEPVIVEDDMDGATDIVFLLIIFFLVASSFSSEKKERLDLTERRQEEELVENAQGEVVAAKPQVQEKYDLRIVIDKDGLVKIDDQEVDLVEPNSLQLYYETGLAVDRKREEILQTDPTRAMVGDPPQPHMVVQLWTDKKSQSGMAMQALMACLDKDLKPDVLFLKELEPNPDLKEIKPDPPAVIPVGPDGQPIPSAPTTP